MSEDKEKKEIGVVADIARMFSAAKRYWIIVAVAVASMIAMYFVPDFEMLPFGVLKFACAFVCALFARHVWLKTIAKYIEKGFFKNDWEKCNPNVRVCVAVIAPVLLFLGAILCFL